MDFEKEAREINPRAQRRYDELMAEGKHGHYETLFKVVNEETRRAFIAGQEVMRESAAQYHSEQQAECIRLYDETVKTGALGFGTLVIASKHGTDYAAIRSLPLQDLTNTSEGVK